MSNKIGFHLIKLAKKVRREIENIASEASQHDSDFSAMSGANGMVIRYLIENKGKDVFQRDIEEHFSLRPSTVSANLKLMEKKGLISREYMEHDTRLKKVVLTDKAIELDKKMRFHFEKIEEKFAQALTEDEQRVFLELIEKMEKQFD